jgi:putative tryptophan/tyrosine transport system substrate-binding protein
MRRRDIITLICGAATWPLAARAQQQKDRVRRIGALMSTAEKDPLSRERSAAFEQGLAKLGWTIDRGVQIDYRWDVATPERAAIATAEVLRLTPDLILANSVSAARAAQAATKTIPIVFNAVSEPVSLGLVESLARPGANITGFTNVEPSVGGKWLELLKDFAPDTRHVAIMFNPASTAIAPQFIRAVQTAAPRFAMAADDARVHAAPEIETVMARVASEPAAALIVLPDTFLSLHYKLIVDAAARHRVPAIYPFRFYTDAGGLICYGPDVTDQFRRAGDYIDRIFRGERPSDLPVQQPTKFDFVINLKAARALGLTVPNTLLVAADQVIE